MSYNLLGDCEKFHRRDVIRVGVLSLLGLSLSKYYALAETTRKNNPNATSGTADSVVLVWMAGGPSHVDSWDPKPNAPVEIRGHFKAINSKADGIQVTEHLAKTASVMDKITLVRSMTSPTAVHEIGTHYMLTGFLPLPGFEVPSYGSVAAKLLGPRSALPPYISVQQPEEPMNAGFLGAALNPYCPGGNPADGNYHGEGLDLPNGMTMQRLDRRRALRDVVDNAFRIQEKGCDEAHAVDEFYDRAYTLLSSEKARAAFDLTKEKPAVRNMYGYNDFGQSMLLTRRLVEAGVRFVTVTMGGWDNHFNIFPAMGDSLLPTFDQGFGTFISDLDQRGLLERTLVVCMGEFGRTPIVNRNAGRDHWPQVFSVVLAGGGVKGGNVVGSSDARGMQVVSSPVHPEDLAATIYQALGIDYTQSISSPEGVRITLARGGSPIQQALA